MTNQLMTSNLSTMTNDSDFKLHKIDFTTKSNFTTGIFEETINWEVLIKFLFSDIILRSTAVKHDKTIVHECERKQAEDLLRLGMIISKHKHMTIDKKLLSLYYHNIEKYLKPSIKVRYLMSKERSIGRVYPVHSLSLGSMRKALRGPLAANSYYDIDMVNCHSSLLNNVFNPPNVTKKKYPNLNAYVVDREKHFQMLGNYYNFDHKTEDGNTVCKELFSRL